MWEGVLATTVGKAWDSVSGVLGKKRDELETEQLRATASKLAAEKVHLETGAQFQREQLDIASRQALHERIVWFCEPFRAECARSLQEFAKQCSRIFVRVAVVLDTESELPSEIRKLFTEEIGRLLDLFADALPYLHGNARWLFSEYFTQLGKCGQYLDKKVDQGSPKEAAKMLAEKYDALVPELRVLVDPLEMYAAIRQASEQSAVDTVSTDEESKREAQSPDTPPTTA